MVNNSDGVDFNENDSIFKGVGDFVVKVIWKESGFLVFLGGIIEVSMDIDDIWRGDDVSY